MPARGGSKGVPNKNLRLVGGISLVGRASRSCRLAAAMLPAREHTVVCSTDSPEIAQEACRWGALVPFMRPAELATDQAGSLDVALHAIDWFKAARGTEPAALVLVQPTSPLTTPDDLAAAVRLFDQSPSDSVSTVRSSPHATWAYRVLDERLVPVSDLSKAERRQDVENVVELNGAAYVATPDFLRKHRRFVVAGATRPSLMDDSRSLDVDTEDQLRACDAWTRGVTPQPIRLGNREIGPGRPCYVIAEGGVNHNGDPALAHRLVDAAADAGADAVKFQTFDPARLAAETAPKAEYQERTTAPSSHRRMLEALVLPRTAHREIAAHARERGIDFLSSPFDEGSADFLRELGIPAFKIPSGEVTNLPFLRHVAAFGRPMLVSSGMCDMVEVAAAVDAVRGNTSTPLALFHCVSNYPAAPASSNLHAMHSLQAAFAVPTGWSDHTPGIEIGIAAVALGAALLEKHLTISKALEGPDHAASLEEQEFAALVRGARAVQSSLGDGVKRPRPEEIPMRCVARKSLHWVRTLAAGHRVRREDLVGLRPGDGLPPGDAERLEGSTLARDVAQGSQARDVDFEVSVSS